MPKQSFTIKSIGRYLPTTRITSATIDEICNVPIGYTEKRSCIKTRYWAEPHETTLFMAKKAIDSALEQASLTINDIDCIINAGCLVPQIVPCTAVLLLAQYNTSKQDCFDIDCTCLSFVKALEIADCLIKIKKYKNIVIFSSELASFGTHKDNHDVMSLFGDGAIAMIISSTTTETTRSTVLASLFQAFPDGGLTSQCRSGGTITHPKLTNQPPELSSFFFEMDGPKLFKSAYKNFPPFLATLLDQANLSLHEIDFVIPHQASYQSIIHLQRLLGITSDKIVCIVEEYGNQVSVSIPNAFYELKKSGRLKPGNKILFLGAAAGLILGGLILEY